MGKILNEMRLFPAEEKSCKIANELYQLVKDLPLVSPHGHTDPRWYALNKAFNNPAELFIIPDHYIFRMLYSQGVDLDDLGLARQDGSRMDVEPRKVWQILADNYYLYRGTPSRLWLDTIFDTVFEMEEVLNSDNAQEYYDIIDAQLKTEEFLPRNLFKRFNIETVSTTENPLDDLKFHKMIRDSDFDGRVISAYRPDTIIDAEHPDFKDNLKKFGEVSGEDVFTYKGYLLGHRARRSYFKEAGGITSTDHGAVDAYTCDLSEATAERLFTKILSGAADSCDVRKFRGHMLLKMAEMSLDDGLVMQMHTGCCRNHNKFLYDKYGANNGSDIPISCDYVHDLKPILNRYGNEKNFRLIIFTMDESTYSRELAPLAGHYPALYIGPAWWFNDSPEGMMRYRRSITETAGFYNTVGFNDDTRAFLSIPARHDVARRVDCSYLASLVTEGRLPMSEAREVIKDLTYNLVKKIYNL